MPSTGYMAPMLDFLRNLLASPADAPGAVPPVQRAVAALLVEAAHCDGAYETAEKAAVGAMLAAIFDLAAPAAADLRAEGEAAQVDAPDLVRFTRVVKTVLTEAQRVAVMEALWSVVLSDGVRHPREDALMRRLAPLIAVSDRDSALARQRVVARNGDPDASA